MKLFKCSAAGALLAAVALSGCVGTSGFSLGGGLLPLDAAVGGGSGSGAGGGSTGGASAPVTPANNGNNDNTNNGGSAPRTLSSLLDPVTDGAGNLVTRVGGAVSGVGDRLPGDGLVQQVVAGVGDTVSGLGAGGLGGLPLVGGTTQSLLGGGDNLVGDLATISALNQAVGGVAPAIGVGALGQQTAGGSVATIGVLSGGNVAQVAMGQSPLSTTVNQVLPATLQNISAVGDATPAGALPPLSNVVGGALSVVGDLGGGAGISVPGLQTNTGGGAAVTPPSLPALPNLPILGGLLGQ